MDITESSGMAARRWTFFHVPYLHSFHRSHHTCKVSFQVPAYSPPKKYATKLKAPEPGRKSRRKEGETTITTVSHTIPSHSDSSYPE